MTDSVVVRHPVRGLLWGLVFGLGLAFVLVFTTIIVFARLPVLTTITIGTAAGLIWSVIAAPGTGCGDSGGTPRIVVLTARR
jgi:hypothetical protein